ncbi:MAG: hypothetical protein ACKVOM_02265 [Ferruginibacter sp.]
MSFLFSLKSFAANELPRKKTFSKFESKQIIEEFKKAKPCCLIIVLNELGLVSSLANNIYNSCTQSGGSNCTTLWLNIYNAGAANVEAQLSNCEAVDGGMQCGDI